MSEVEAHLEEQLGEAEAQLARMRATLRAIVITLRAAKAGAPMDLDKLADSAQAELEGAG